MEPTIDPALFRRILARFPTGIAIVTTENRGSLHGITVNTLTSVSLDPLLILVCIDRQAKAHAEIEQAGRFGINLLSSEQEPLSRTFAEHGDPEPGRLRGASFRIGPHGTPLLEGCIAHLECALAERVPGGDHTIFLGAVLGGGIDTQASPLVYFERKYRGLDR